MAEIIANISTQGGELNPGNTTLTQSSTESNTTITTIGIQGTSGALVPLSENAEVDVISEGLQNGSVLVYKTATSKWTSTKNLNLQNVDSGEF
ncbi:hypothetical protein EBU71_01405 [bacterium]|nr:hypothetical protein [Candidatus Elulimicrobium humile]